MKFLRYFLILILAFVGVFFLIGMMNPHVQYGHTITVDKPLKEAWAVTQDESKYDQWLKGYKSMELISGEPFQVGSKYKIIVNPGEGQEDFEMIETVMEMEEFDHVTMHFDSEGMNFEQTISCKEENGKTIVATDSKVIGKNLIARSMFATMEMLGGAFTAQETENMENLKKVINANTTDYFPEPIISENEPITEEIVE